MPRPLIDRDGPEVGRDPGTDDLGGRGFHVETLPKLQHLGQTPRPVGQRALLLHLNLGVCELTFQRLVFCPHPPQVDVLAPRTADVPNHRRGSPFELGKHPEGDRLDNGHARLRIDLRRNEKDMADDRRQQQISCARTCFEAGHYCQLITTKDTMDTKGSSM